MKQGEAVKNSILSVLKSKGINYVLNGETPVSKYKDQFKEEVINQICEGFMNGTIDMSAEAKAKYNTFEKLKKEYVPGLVDNWVRKTKEFNGGMSYQIKNPGSRSGSKDPQITAMRNLLKTVSDPAQKKLIEDSIAERIAELKPETVVEIDVNALPDHLKHLVE